MKRLLYIVIALYVAIFMASGCSGTGSATQSTDTVQTDTVTHDTLETLLEETPMPAAADELFDDFIFNFAANRRLQMERILFPLKTLRGTQVSHVEKSQWRMEHFFMKQGYYTLVLDNKRQLQLTKDTAVAHVVIERINIPKRQFEAFVFDRQRGEWYLTEVQYQPLQANAKANFLNFYEQFVTDTAFQHQSLAETIDFRGPDPDDDFSTMEGIITPDTWQAFAPELPHGIIYDINYGDQSKSGWQKVLLLRGISNGLEMELTFTRKKGQWLLTRLNE